jgi:anti-anti-sigma factor
MKVRLLAREAGLARLACEGDVTLWPAHGAPNPLDQVLAPDDYGRPVLLDLSQAGHIDSSGIGWLIASHQKCQKGGGRFIVYAAPPQVKNIIDLVRLDEVLLVAADEAAARALLARPRT